jgi:hypothetical protein
VAAAREPCDAARPLPVRSVLQGADVLHGRRAAGGLGRVTRSMMSRSCRVISPAVYAAPSSSLESRSSENRQVSFCPARGLPPCGRPPAPRCVPGLRVQAERPPADTLAFRKWPPILGTTPPAVPGLARRPRGFPVVHARRVSVPTSASRGRADGGIARIRIARRPLGAGRLRSADRLPVPTPPRYGYGARFARRDASGPDGSRHGAN